jgi:hypothetical protein
LTATATQVRAGSSSTSDQAKSSEQLTSGEVIKACLVSILLTVVITWPMAIKVGSSVPAELNDPLQMAWEVAWIGHAILHQPGDFFQANNFYPLKNSLAFTDVVAGYAPLAIIGQGPDAALIRYNLINLFTYAFAFVGAYLLARELGAGQLAAGVAGAGFGFAPWRIAQANHLPVLSTGGIALSLFLLIRGYKRRQPTVIMAGWLVAVWQLSMGFTHGLPFAYLLAILGGIAALVWLRMRRPRIERTIVISTAVGALVFAGYGLVMARPFLQVANEHDAEITERLEEVEYYSPPARAFLTAPEESLVWGRPTARFRDFMFWPPEQTLFPGVVLTGLAVLGSLAPIWRKRLRAGLVAGVVITSILALGVSVADGAFSYRLLQQLPGWGAVRTPGRIFVFTSLGLAVLGSAGAQFLLSRVEEARKRRWPSRRRLQTSRWFVGVGLCALVLLEGAGRPALVKVPTPPADLLGAPSPQLHLPIGRPDALYMYWSIAGFPRMPNGWGTFYPESVRDFQRDMLDFPNESSVRRLKDLGIRVVIFHPDLAAGTPWQSLPNRSLEGLNVTKRSSDDVMLYYLDV